MPSAAGHRLSTALRLIERGTRDGTRVYARPSNRSGSSTRLVEGQGRDSSSLNWLHDIHARLPFETTVGRVAAYLQNGVWPAKPASLRAKVKAGITGDDLVDPTEAPELEDCSPQELGHAVMVVLHNNAPLIPYTLFADVVTAATDHGMSSVAHSWHTPCVLTAFVVAPYCMYGFADMAHIETLLRHLGDNTGVTLRFLTHLLRVRCAPHSPPPLPFPLLRPSSLNHPASMHSSL